MTVNHDVTGSNPVGGVLSNGRETSSLVAERLRKVTHRALYESAICSNFRGSQTQDLASVSSVRTTEFRVRNLNTVVRFHYTPLHGRLPKSGYKGVVLKTIRSVKRHVGSNPTSSFILIY